MGIYTVWTSIDTWRKIPLFYGIASRNRLCVWFISSVPLSKTFIIKTGENDRTNLGTITASRAFIKVYMPGNFIQGYLKVAGISGYCRNFR